MTSAHAPRNLFEQLTPNHLLAMRHWCVNALWRDADDEYIVHEAPTEKVLAAVERTYSGGVAQFLRDADAPPVF